MDEEQNKADAEEVIETTVYAITLTTEGSPNASIEGIRIEAPENYFREAKDGALDAIKEVEMRLKKEGLNLKNANILFIKMPCGKSISFKKYEDIPDESMPCTCGNPKHYFIRYVKTEDVPREKIIGLYTKLQHVEV
jgi:hypothetical protein